MSASITVPADFETKLMDRLRDSIGELLSDEDLRRIVHKGVEKALFEPRNETKSGNYYDRDNIIRKPPFIEEAVMVLLRERMTVEVNAWVAANPEKMEAIVRDTLAKGVGGCVEHAMNAKFSSMFGTMIDQLQSAGIVPKGDYRLNGGQW